MHEVSAIEDVDRPTAAPRYITARSMAFDCAHEKSNSDGVGPRQLLNGILSIHYYTTRTNINNYRPQFGDTWRVARAACRTRSRHRRPKSRSSVTSF